MIAVLVPVLARPENARRVAESCRENSTKVTSILFLCSPGDEEEIAACAATGEGVWAVSWEAGSGDWALKINEGYRITSEPYLLLGADDLCFHAGWDDAALEVALTTGAGVTGTNDLGNALVMRGGHSTHPLIERGYVEQHGTIDEDHKILHEGYAHQWVDNELVATAKMRREWAFAMDSHVEHLHPFWGKSKMDATYEKALSTSREDARLFRQRHRLLGRARV